TNLYHDMYKGLDEFNMSLQRYNSLLKSDLEAANEAQRKLEIEIASNFGGGPHVAMTHPTALTNCNIDMESLISDQNRSIATLAITTLLKTGNELKAIRSLCLKFPLKYNCDELKSMGTVIKSVDRELTIGTLNFPHHTQQKMEDTVPISEGLLLSKIFQ
ncbi:hypothetical protein S245_005985, partial [Arachis hypogaea]